MVPGFKRNNNIKPQQKKLRIVSQCVYINKNKVQQNIKKIGPSAFNACYSLENINLEGLEELEVSAFNSVLYC